MMRDRLIEIIKKLYDFPCDENYEHTADAILSELKPDWEGEATKLSFLLCKDRHSSEHSDIWQFNNDANSFHKVLGAKKIRIFIQEVD